MLNSFTLTSTVGPATEFFGHISTPIFWIAGIGVAFTVAGWAIAKARRSRRK